MVKKIIDRVTVTGADDSVLNPWLLVEIAEKYPFVEFGILLSKKQEGYKLFPSLQWMERFKEIAKMNRLVLSGHLCGSWVRDLCVGRDAFFKERRDIIRVFSRFQLNFHAEKHVVNSCLFCRTIHNNARKKQIIFQMDGVNDTILFRIQGCSIDLDLAPLFDQSGGIGLLPEVWPKAVGHCGYAGGLSPLNVSEEMEKITEVAGNGPIWIDAETHLRSNNDEVFDLDKVRAFLEAAKPWVIGQ